MSGWVLQSEGEKPLTLRIPFDAVRTLGRTARADFIVNAPLVSRLHCRLTTDAAGALQVEDLGSTNGTVVNGKRVERAVLKDGDLLGVGRMEFKVSAT